MGGRETGVRCWVFGCGRPEGRKIARRRRDGETERRRERRGGKIIGGKMGRKTEDGRTSNIEHSTSNAQAEGPKRRGAETQGEQRAEPGAHGLRTTGPRTMSNIRPPTIKGRSRNAEAQRRRGAETQGAEGRGATSNIQQPTSKESRQGARSGKRGTVLGGRWSVFIEQPTFNVQGAGRMTNDEVPKEGPKGRTSNIEHSTFNGQGKGAETQRREEARSGETRGRRRQWIGGHEPLDHRQRNTESGPQMAQMGADRSWGARCRGQGPCIGGQSAAPLSASKRGARCQRRTSCSGARGQIRQQNDLHGWALPEPQVISENGLALGELGRREVDGVWQLEC